LKTTYTLKSIQATNKLNGSAAIDVPSFRLPASISRRQVPFCLFTGFLNDRRGLFVVQLASVEA